MRIYSTANMKKAEELADNAGHSYRKMMLMAGHGVAKFIDHAHRFDKPKTCVVFCGRGNNGGDGYVIAEYLHKHGWRVAAVSVGDPPMRGLPAEMHKRCIKAGVTVVPCEYERLQTLCGVATVLVDAIVGTGFSGELHALTAQCTHVINNSRARVYAVDLPTGVSADDGTAAKGSVTADVTLTFDSKKPAHFIVSGRRCCGQVVVLDIGIPSFVRASIKREHFYVTKRLIERKIPPRPLDCHKGDFGKLLTVVGSGRYMGAALLAVQGALRSGVGYVTLAAPKEVCKTLLTSVPECIMLGCDATRELDLSKTATHQILERAKGSTAILIGCGLGTGSGAEHVTEQLLLNVNAPMVIDADGLNLLSQNIKLLDNRRCEVVLTPHMAEFARLINRDINYVVEHSYELGWEFARRYRVTLLLKGAVTMVFSPKGVCRYVDSGSPGMAKAGSGDVLAGIIGGLLAGGLTTFDAAACGAWLHGRAGSLAAKKYSTTAMLPHEIPIMLGQVFLELGI